MTKREEAEAEKDAALEKLRGAFPPGSAVYTIMRHVSDSGMTCSISVLYADGGEISDLSYLLRRAGFGRFNLRYGGIIQSGCGMDMAFGLVRDLSRTLYGDGYALNQRVI